MAGIKPLYEIEDPRKMIDKTQGKSRTDEISRGITQNVRSMTKDLPKPGAPPKHTAGGAIMAGGSGAAMGMMAWGAMEGAKSGNPYAIGIGALIGLAAYYLQ